MKVKNKANAILENLDAACVVGSKFDCSTGRGGASIYTNRREGVLGCDPRTHLVAICVFGATAIVVSSLRATVGLQIVAALYLLLNGRARLAGKTCASFAAICVLSFLPLSGLYGVLLVSLLHMMPSFTVGCALFTLSPSAVMCALERMHAPRGLQVGACMVFRFASVLPLEAKSIFRGIRMRGIFPHWYDVLRHPDLAYECFYLPLVLRCLRLSSELAASAELRGINAAGQRTSAYHIGLSQQDAAVCSVVIAANVLLGRWG